MSLTSPSPTSGGVGLARAGPLLAHPARCLAEYRSSGGYDGLQRAVQAHDPRAVLEAVERAGCRGRGGAAYPTALKWHAALAHPGPRYVVCNGGEDEPGSLKDRLLMEEYPHAVLDGALLAAFAVQAARIYLYVNVGFYASLRALQRAVAEARSAGLVGPNAFAAGLDVEVDIIEAPPVYVAGEETAALEVIEGRPPLPRRKPPYPTEAGVWGRPTVVNNVETLAVVAAVVRDGPTAYRGLGTPESPGTLLVTLSGWVERPGVYEVAFGTPMRTIIDTLGGGVRGGKSLRAFSPGGASTAYLGLDKLDVRLDYADLQAAGSAVGCATIRVVPEGACMVEELQRFASFFADGSCHQCGPCQQGTRKIANVTEEIRLGALDQRPLDTLARLGQRLRGMGICGLITGATFPAASALALFPGDFAQHARYGVCPGLGFARPLPHHHAWAPSRTEALRRPHLGGVRRSRWY